MFGENGLGFLGWFSGWFWNVLRCFGRFSYCYGVIYFVR